ncbi:hypothetical protein V3N99_09505 [Dermatophilaceae bacterium Soc4.6]
MSLSSGKSGTTAVASPRAIVETALSADVGLLSPGLDLDLGRSVAALCRHTGAVLAALCLLDGDEQLVTSIFSVDAAQAADSPTTVGGQRSRSLGEGESFVERLRVLTSAAGGRCVVAQHEVVVDGHVVGLVGMGDRDRHQWSADDLTALAEAADVVSAWIQTRVAMVEVSRVQQPVAAHNEVHDMIARDLPLREVLTAACAAIERYDPSLMPSVLQLDPESNTLHSGVGPSFPQEYLDAVEGAPIGPSIGTCGPAAWFGQSPR